MRKLPWNLEDEKTALELRTRRTRCNQPSGKRSTTLRHFFQPILPALMLFCACGPAAWSAPAASQVLRVSNDRSFARVNEVVRIPRRDLQGDNSTNVPVFEYAGKVLVSQLVSSDGGPQWDAALVQVSLPPNASESVSIRWVKPSDAPQFPVRAGVRMSLRSLDDKPTPEIRHEERERGFVQSTEKPKYQMQGPGIENDKFALRVFFDHLNGKDLYGKLADLPVLSQIGLGGSWHKLQPWGMDILKTANSIGAEGLAVQEGGTIYRLADADHSVYDALYNGPLQSAFRLRFTGWDIGTTRGPGEEYLSMTVGQYLMEEQLTVSLAKNQMLVTGLPSFYPSLHLKHTIYNEKISSISTYGPQAEGTGTSLGLAIFFPTESFRELRTATSDDKQLPSSSYVVLDESQRKQHRLVFAACWEKTDKRFATEQGFEDYLAHEAEIMAHPIQFAVTAQR